MKQLILLVLALAAVGVVLAVKFLPWWGLVLCLGLVLVLAKFTVKRVLYQALVTPFKMKGAVLRGATIEVHSIAKSSQRAPEKSDHDEEANVEDSGPRLTYELEVSIRPQNSKGPFQLWEPGELLLVRPDSKIVPSASSADDSEDDTCRVIQLLIEEEGSFKKDEGGKYPGEQKLQFLLSVKPGHSQLKFQYYFEEFGLIQLPPQSAEAIEAA